MNQFLRSNLVITYPETRKKLLQGSQKKVLFNVENTSTNKIISFFCFLPWLLMALIQSKIQWRLPGSHSNEIRVTAGLIQTQMAGYLGEKLNHMPIFHLAFLQVLNSTKFKVWSLAGDEGHWLTMNIWMSTLAERMLTFMPGGMLECKEQNLKKKNWQWTWNFGFTLAPKVL